MKKIGIGSHGSLDNGHRKFRIQKSYTHHEAYDCWLMSYDGALKNGKMRIAKPFEIQWEEYPETTTFPQPSLILKTAEVMSLANALMDMDCIHDQFLKNDREIMRFEQQIEILREVNQKFYNLLEKP